MSLQGALSSYVGANVFKLLRLLKGRSFWNHHAFETFWGVATKT